ncbi:MBL fold metallo-hydrolase [Microbacterium murale]|uniref:Glyoxylase-like metal-dependent hydrolase (Beta-lactamase superfamily II) n=1 Tax=Microbacterium murale TaxID=1081040 RepID=A0ABU0P9L0_9MICO|nr:MBL fold metallo-hydrolase [Microbacterium murale]MDQ0644016.1 glyoxylase-like metal-dependent hydrolase (beta-lactamase superfamily II) [Microbacterium murale]
MQIRPGVHRIVAPLGERFIAMYLLTGPEGALLFDTGVADSVPGTLLPYFDEIGFDPAELRWVISSHCDFDHTGGNAALRAVASNAEFLAGRADVPMTEDVELLISGRYGEFAARDRFDDPPETTAEVRRSTGLVAVGRALDGGEVFDLGDRTIEVLAVPGHSPGHLALWDATNRTALISDAVLGETVPTADGRAAFPPTYRDTVAYVDSIRRLHALEADLLLTAHYPVYDGDGVEAFLDESLAYTELVDRVIEEVLASGEELASLELIRRAAPSLGPWPDAAVEYLIFPMTGNLERLVDQARVIEGERDGVRTWRRAA